MLRRKLTREDENEMIGNIKYSTLPSNETIVDA